MLIMPATIYPEEILFEILEMKPSKYVVGAPKHRNDMGVLVPRWNAKPYK
jgi:hypothetical protein